MSFFACLRGKTMDSRGARQQKNQIIVVILLALSTLCLVKHNENLHWEENFSLMCAMIVFSVS